VVLVTRMGESRYYAMKVLVSGESAGGADLAQVKRFFREAKILASIDHPNVVKLVEYGFSEKNIPFIIMEYVDGKSLDEHIRDPQFDFLRRLIVLEQVTKALAVVHERGVLHRDIRPGNVLVTPQFTAKLADFGLAGLADSTLTMARELLGGPSTYLPPEAWDDPKRFDERSDLFSLGVLAYELFTRRLPFTGKTPVQLREAIAHGRPEAPHKLNPEVGPELEDILAKLLAKDPAERWPRAGDVADALRQCHERRSGAGWQILGAFRSGKSVWQ
jgi:eukaryotic-like serine/threonine-protein kinase